MATQEYAASIQGVSIRVTRLDAAGNLLNGPGDSYTTSAFMRVSFTPEYEEGDEITEKSANGTVCVTYKAPDTLKRITMELAICEPKLRQSGDRVIENGMLATTFEGYGLGNKNFGSGSDGRWEFPVASERPYSYSRSSWAPIGLAGFYTWTDEASYQKFFTKSGIQGATDIAVDSIYGNGNVATVTLSDTTANASIVTGDKIYVNNCGEPFNTTTVGTAITVLGNQTAAANVTASNTTITVADTTGYVVGQAIAKVSGGATLANTTIATIVNSTAFTVTTAPTGNGNLVFSIAGGTAFYYTTNANLSSNLTATLDKYSRINLVDSVTEAGSYTAVTTTAIDTKYANGSGEDTYNVPGNLNYVSDNNVDFIIKSNED